ncbi:MAG: MlaD family protein [Phycisphaerae bacterium]|jgi:phospholipid/cholesterol/gamma-HCH transport system substrate-binding protein
MKAEARNLAVGVTVIIALSMLGVLILLFTGLPGVLNRGYKIHMEFDSTHDLIEGDSVFLAGIRVGSLTEVDFIDPAAPGKGVRMTALINHSVRLPGNTQAFVYTKGLMGKGYLSLSPEGALPTNPATGKVIEYLPTDGSVVLVGQQRGNGLFPPEVTDAVKNLSSLAKNLNELVAPAPSATAATGPDGQTQPASGPSPRQNSLQGSVAKFNRTLDALYAVIGDEKNQANIKASLANLAVVTAEAKEAMVSFKAFAQQATEATKDVSKVANSAGQRIDELARKLMDDADAVSRLMSTMQETVRKLGEGEGTTGKLINDPKLYNNLVDATKQMTDLMTEMRDLVKTWRESGVEMKLK